MQALELEHPQHLVRDTAKYPPLMVTTAAGRKPHARSLRVLALEHLALVIQAGEHTPVDDARAALYLYQQHRKVWLKASGWNGVAQPWCRLGAGASQSSNHTGKALLWGFRS